MRGGGGEKVGKRGRRRKRIRIVDGERSIKPPWLILECPKG